MHNFPPPPSNADSYELNVHSLTALYSSTSLSFGEGGCIVVSSCSRARRFVSLVMMMGRGNASGV